MKVKIGYILSTLMLCFNLTAKAQVTVEQMVDSIGILIGEQAHLSLKVTFPQGSRLQWPNLKERQYVTPGVEIVDIAKPDTIGKEGNSLQVERVYTITSFDERLYAIPALTVKVNGKPYQGANSNFESDNSECGHPAPKSVLSSKGCAGQSIQMVRMGSVLLAIYSYRRPGFGRRLSIYSTA